MPERTVRRHLIGGKWVAKGRGDVITDPVDPPVDPPSTGIFWTHYDTRNRAGYGSGFDATDQLLADSIGVGRPLGTFIHGYSGNSHPASFSSSSVSSAASRGIGAMLNTKLDWRSLANGDYDSLIAGFWNSWPTAVHGMVTVNHEPENDGPTPANATNAAYVTWANTNGPIWKAGIARYLSICAPIIRARNLKVRFGGCLMDFSWDVIGGTVRWPYWDWWNEPEIADNLDVVTFGIDAYWKHLDNPVRGVSPNARVNELLAVVRSKGIESLSFWETAVDRRLRNGGSNPPIIGTNQSLSNWWISYAAFLNTIPEVDYVAYFHIPDGPASQQAYLDGVAVPTFAQICLEGRRKL